MLVVVEIPGQAPPKLVYAPSFGSGVFSSALVSAGLKLKGKSTHGSIHRSTRTTDQRRNGSLL